jgi:hypothetical protein
MKYQKGNCLFNENKELDIVADEKEINKVIDLIKKRFIQHLD